MERSRDKAANNQNHYGLTCWCPRTTIPTRARTGEALTFEISFAKGDVVPIVAALVVGVVFVGARSIPCPGGRSMTK